eukprot:TRINITY_DN10871_c0_g2_i2.p1 TRINITY_DN10871_c0_g2~~TRINITY_DN10871_c0_g2_i2.p1  ORF type:complete len:1169 (+),score=386.65 TRINITY_DN10871_c0_g2_i2:156-3662(+)
MHCALFDQHACHICCNTFRVDGRVRIEHNFQVETNKSMASASANGNAEPMSSLETSDLPLIDDLYELVDPKNPEKLAEFGGAVALAKRLGSDEKQGLDPKYQERNAEFYGVNRLPEARFKSLLELVWLALHDRTLIMLMIAACISLAIGISTEGPELGWKDGVAVLVAVMVVVAIDSLNDYSKEKQFRALNEVKNDRQVTVVRNGANTRISIYDLVVGDIVVMQTGDIIPADGVFLHGDAAEADESSATGESINLKKGHAPNRDPIFLSGTQLVAGQATMLAVCVGESSFNGRIMLALRTPDEDTPLQEKLSKLADAIGNFGIFAAVFIFSIQLIKYFAINGDDLDGGETGQNVVDFLVIAISIVVVAVPEGLPLSVTISLAYSMKLMMKEQNLVRHLDACETMGGATTVCSDKTGTLTQNKMTVVQGRLLGVPFAQDSHGNAGASGKGEPWPVNKDGRSDKVDAGLIQAFFAGNSLNSTAYESTNDEGEVTFVGSKTECALLEFGRLYGFDFAKQRDDISILATIPFSSSLKRMSTVIDYKFPGSDKPYTFHTKGAAEIVLNMCSHVALSSGEIVEMTAEHKTHFQELLVSLSDQALRAICLAAKPVEDPEEDVTTTDKPGMICLGMVGIQDPLRPGIARAVANCESAGVTVRMVTGDSLAIAKSIAKECGIYRPEEGHEAMQGPDFRKMSDAQIDAVLPRLRILARSSPTDKFKLVSALQRLREVVAVTGDGVNDGPALKKADVGFAMGLSGTDVAKEASAIVLLDDNFTSIVSAIKWGRGVFDGIRKFLQFQLAVNFTAILVVFIAIIADPEGESDNAPLKPVQLLWINIIMDSFAALALSTEVPTEEVLKYKPYDRNEPLLTRFMQRRMGLQVILQTITFLLLLFAGEELFETEKRPEDNEDTTYSVRHLTVVFNTFVLSQLVNQINSRKLRGEMNVFDGLLRHHIFIGVWLLSFVIQVLMVQYGGVAIETEALTAGQWGGCIAIAVLPLVWGFIFALLPDSITREPWPWMYRFLDNVVKVFPCVKRCHNPGDDGTDEELNRTDSAQQHVLEGASSTDVNSPLMAKRSPRQNSQITIFPSNPAEPPLSVQDVTPNGSAMVLDVDDALAVPHGAMATLPADASPQLRRAVSIRSQENLSRSRWQRAIGDVQTQISVIDMMRRHRR